MSTESSVYLGFEDGASRHIQNLSSATWVIYSPEGLFVSSGGICLGPFTNNVAEYGIVIELLHDSISHGIRTLEVHLDSQLVVCQLNDRYCVSDPSLLQQFLRVHILERHFDFITYYHIMYLMIMLNMF
jgi:ribonuclease HI